MKVTLFSARMELFIRIMATPFFWGGVFRKLELFLANFVNTSENLQRKITVLHFRILPFPAFPSLLQDYEARFALWYAKLLEKMASHVMLSCKSRFETDQYRKPSFRVDLLTEVDYEYQDLRMFIKSQFEGLETLSSTLTKWKKSEGHIIAGTYDGAWLQDTPNAAERVAEWEAGLTLLEERFISLHDTLLAKAKANENNLVEQATQELSNAEADICRIFKVDIQDEYIEKLLTQNYEKSMQDQVCAAALLQRATIVAEVRAVPAARLCQVHVALAVP